MLFSDEHVTFSSHNSYLMNHLKNGFTNDDIALFPENDSYLAIGAMKSAHVIEGPTRSNDQRSTGLIVQG